MSYNINKTDESVLVTLADGVTDTNYSSLTLIGKNFAGYGEFINENFVRLLENFSRITSPLNPIEGQLWWDNANDVMKVWNGYVWKAAGGMTMSASEPLTPVEGDLWWDSAVNHDQLKAYNGASWIVVGPVYTSGQGVSGFKIETVVDSLDASHTVAKLYVSTVLVAIVSKDATFTPAPAITGFPTIIPGINIFAASGSPYSYLNGTATDTLKLGGALASAYVKAADAAVLTAQLTVQTDSGIVIGDPGNVEIKIVSGDLYILNKAANKNIILSVMKGAVQTPVITVDGTTGAAIVNVAPTVDFGIVNKKYVDDIVTGVSSPALARAGGNTITGVISPDGNGTRDFGSSIARFATIYATTFNGVATTAKYADLAERFSSDRAYAPGTVVELGGVEEVTAVGEELSNNVFGVVSSKAAYLMNAAAGDDATHPAIAMQGRVPVNVIGKVKKGDRLVSAGNGLARAARNQSDITPFNVIGRALENKLTDGEGTVEAVVRLNS